MANQLSDPQSKVDRWLYDRGFILGNPFKKTAADDERELPIEELFVPIGDYDRIRGNETVLVFAPRGAGKSTLRIRLAAISLPQDISASTLAIECTDFSWLVERYRQYDGQITEADYEIFLLRQAAKALIEQFLPSKSLPANVDAKEDFRKREQKAKEVPSIVRAQISAFIRRYYPALLSPRELFNYMLRLSKEFNGEWLDFQAAANNRKLKGYLVKTNLAPKLYGAWLLAELCDEDVSTYDQYRSVIDAFQELVQIAQAIQIKQVHFLVDRLDEMQLFANDYELQADILEPLLAYLNLLELDGVAFKFFVAKELYQVLLKRKVVRKDRLLNKAVTIQWNDENLKILLENRLRYFSQEKVPSLLTLCDEKGETVESDLIRTAMGSPRRLLTGGQLLMQAHVTDQAGNGQISPSAWQVAKVQLLQLMPPTLQLRLDERLVVKAGEEISLTKIEVKILHALVAYDGYCPRERLIEQVWGVGADQGVSDDAVNQAFKRLRDKIGETEPTAVYLHILKGANPGFRLENYEQAD